MEGKTKTKTNKTPVQNKGHTNKQQSKEQKVNFGDLLWVKIRKSSWWPAQVVDENTVSGSNKPSSKRSSRDVLVRLFGSYNYMYVDVHESRAKFKKVLKENNSNHFDVMKKTLEQDLSRLKSGGSRQQKSKPKGTVKTKASENGSLVKPSSSKPEGSSKKRKQETEKTAKPHLETPKVKSGVHQNAEPSTPKIGSSKKRKQETEKTAKPHLETPKVKSGVHQNAEPSTSKIVNSEPQETSARRTKVMQSLGLIAPLGSPFPRNGQVLSTPSAS